MTRPTHARTLPRARARKRASHSRVLWVMLITKDMLLAWGACWSERDIGNHLGERAGMTPREVAEDETIPLSDRLWVMCGAVLCADDTAKLADTFARHAWWVGWSDPPTTLWRRLDPAPGYARAEVEAERRRIIARALELLGPESDSPAPHVRT